MSVLLHRKSTKTSCRFVSKDYKCPVIRRYLSDNRLLSDTYRVACNARTYMLLCT